MAEKGTPLPKFGEWDVNNPASAEKYTFIFNKARIEKKGGITVNPKFPNRDNRHYKKNTVVLGKPQPKRWLCCVKVDNAE